MEQQNTEFLNAFIVTLLKEYANSIIPFSKLRLSPHMEETDIYHEGDKFKVKYDDKSYLLYNSKGFFFGGNVDDGDFKSTISNDCKTFGMVISALAHLNNQNYLDILWKDKIETFFNQLEYVLGYCIITLPDGSKIQLKEFVEDTKRTMLRDMFSE